MAIAAGSMPRAAKPGPDGGLEVGVVGAAQGHRILEHARRGLLRGAAAGGADVWPAGAEWERHHEGPAMKRFGPGRVRIGSAQRCTQGAAGVQLHYIAAVQSDPFTLADTRSLP